MSSTTKLWRLLGAGVIALLALASVAVAAGITQTYSQKFTTTHPGQVSGMSFRAGGSPQAKSVTLTFPAGTVINTKAVARCTGASSCPAASKVGAGTATVRVAGAAAGLAATAYNRAGGMVIIIPAPIGSVVLRPTLSGRKLSITIPSLKVAGSAVTLVSLKLDINAIGSGTKAYLRTPASCPKAKVWTFTGRFTYSGGRSRTLTSRSACVKS